MLKEALSESLRVEVSVGPVCYSEENTTEIKIKVTFEGEEIAVDSTTLMQK